MGRNEKSPRTVHEAFKLADDVESQLQDVDSFKLELSNNFSSVEDNEMSVWEFLGDEFEVNEMSRGKKWGNNNNYKIYNPNNNHNCRPQYNKTQDNKTGKTLGQKEKDSKITLTRVTPLRPYRIQQQSLQTILSGNEDKKGGTEEAR